MGIDFPISNQVEKIIPIKKLQSLNIGVKEKKDKESTKI